MSRVQGQKSENCFYIITSQVQALLMILFLLGKEMNTGWKALYISLLTLRKQKLTFFSIGLSHRISFLLCSFCVLSITFSTYFSFSFTISILLFFPLSFCIFSITHFLPLLCTPLSLIVSPGWCGLIYTSWRRVNPGQHHTELLFTNLSELLLAPAFFLNPFFPSFPPWHTHTHSHTQSYISPSSSVLFQVGGVAMSVLYCPSHTHFIKQINMGSWILFPLVIILVLSSNTSFLWMET